MLYKLYIQSFKKESLADYELFKDIAKIYQDNGVMVLGHWINQKNEDETVLITVYKDEAHYQRFIEKMKSDPQYQERQEFLNSVRESYSSKDLKINKHSLMKPSNMDFMEYIKDVKSMIEEYEF